MRKKFLFHTNSTGALPPKTAPLLSHILPAMSIFDRTKQQQRERTEEQVKEPSPFSILFASRVCTDSATTMPVPDFLKIPKNITVLSHVLLIMPDFEFLEFPRCLIHACLLAEAISCTPRELTPQSLHELSQDAKCTDSDFRLKEFLSNDTQAYPEYPISFKGYIFFVKLLIMSNILVFIGSKAYPRPQAGAFFTTIR